jgi:ERCC4-type nuclease
MLSKDPFVIIVDTREQIPWEFGFHVTSHKKLNTGDYSIEGLEHILCIERKRSVSEIANNISEPRFKDVLDRMDKIKHSFILLEFSLDDLYSFPVGSDIPEKLWDKIKITSKYLLKYLIQIQLNRNIHIVFCGSPDNAEKMAISIMKRIYEKYGEH